MQIVKPSSGQLYLPNEEQISIHTTHTDMVKFSAMSNQHFQTVANRMTTWLGSEHQSSALVVV